MIDSLFTQDDVVHPHHQTVVSTCSDTNTWDSTLYSLLNTGTHAYNIINIYTNTRTRIYVISIPNQANPSLLLLSSQFVGTMVESVAAIIAVLLLITVVVIIMYHRHKSSQSYAHYVALTTNVTTTVLWKHNSSS